MKTRVKRWKILSQKQKVAWEALSPDSPVTDVFWGGSAGGGKSSLGSMWQQDRRIRYPGTRGFIGRDTLKNLYLTTLESFWEMWEKYYRYNPLGVQCRHNQKTDVIHFSNGSQINLMELSFKPQLDPYFTRLGSLNLSDAFVDEAPGVSEKAVLILKSRIRWKMPGGIPKLLLTGNPANNWIKWTFVMDKRGRPVKLQPYQMFIKATLHDNPDPKFVESYLKQLQHLPAMIRARLLEGDWTINENERPFFYSYSDIKHISSSFFVPDPFLPLILSFDFNVQPTTCIVAQKLDTGVVRILRVHQCDGGTERLCREELLPRQYHKHRAGLLITGDISGKAQHSSQAATEYGDLQTDYGIIKRMLAVSDFDIVHTGHQNPRLLYSRRVCNYALQQQVVEINTSECEALVSDLNNARPTESGSLFKNREQGHGNDAADCFRYLIHLVYPGGYPDIDNAAAVLHLHRQQEQVKQSFHSLEEWRKGTDYVS